VAEGVNDSAETPAVLVADRRRLASSGRERLVDDLVGIVDDEQGPARCAVDRHGAVRHRRRDAGAAARRRGC
jgi:hypothetical protein